MDLSRPESALEVLVFAVGALVALPIAVLVFPVVLLALEFVVGTAVGVLRIVTGLRTVRPLP